VVVVVVVVVVGVELYGLCYNDSCGGSSWCRNTHSLVIVLYHSYYLGAVVANGCRIR